MVEEEGGVMDGSLYTVEETSGTRHCKTCRHKIKARESMLAGYVKSKWGVPARTNHCRQCAVKKLIELRHMIDELEVRLYGEEGC